MCMSIALNCFCVTFDVHVNCPRSFTRWTTSEVLQFPLVALSLESFGITCVVLGPSVVSGRRSSHVVFLFRCHFGDKVFATHTLSRCFNCHFGVMLPTHDELVLIAATNQPVVRLLKSQWGLPLFLARQLRHHCRQLLRGSASHPTRGMLSTKNWAVSLGYATSSTSPRRTGKT